jgi:hypothetical protein
MRKALKVLDGLGLSFLFFLILVSLTFFILQDRLLFKTDPANLIHFFLATAFILSFAFTSILLFFHFKTGDAAHTHFLKIFSILILGQILFGMLISYWDGNVVFEYTITQLSMNAFGGSRVKAYFSAGIIILIFSCTLSYLISRFNHYTPRMVTLGKAFFIISFIYFTGFSVYKQISYLSGSSKPKKNLILIVLDGLSTRYLSTYSPDIKTPEMDEIAAQSMVYTNIRTNHTHTFGYFSTLYSGRKGLDDELSRKHFGLLHSLQNANINTRWISYHNNGVPDISHQQYHGLRSTYLTSATAWIPRFLGIDYNIWELPTANGRGRLTGDRQNAMLRWLFSKWEKSFLNPLENSFIEEIKGLRADARPFFIIHHLPPNALTSRDRTQNIWETENNHLIPKDHLEKVKQKILRNNDYTYSKEDVPAVKVFEKQYQQLVSQGIASLNAFIKTFKQNGWDQDTCLIITADHGKIFSKGKFAYGFHNEEEVARVPLYILCNGKTGVDPRLGDSIDITQTILDYFSVEQPLSPNARSLFSKEGKSHITTLSRISNKRKEWFLNIYTKDLKYVFNIASKNEYVKKEKFSNYFDTQTVATGPAALESSDFDLNQILKDYKIQDVSLKTFTGIPEHNPSFQNN